jgi:hypothetical protein
MAINRGPFNALVDDDGSNTLGTIWDKAHIASVLLDPTDVALAGLPEYLRFGVNGSAPGPSLFRSSNDLVLRGGSTGIVVQNDGGTATLAALSNTGLLSVNGFGTHTFSAGGSGSLILQLRNTAAGQNDAALYLGNDVSASRVRLHSLASAYTPSGIYKPDGAVLNATGTGGLSLAAQDGAGAIRFYAGGQVERMKLSANGEFQVGPDLVIGNAFTVFSAGGGRLNLGAPGTAATTVIAFYNVNGQIGSIVTSGTDTTYNTTSDERLKRDLGIAEDLTALRAVVVHDFVWAQDGRHSRGIFAQETAPVFPRAITVGSDGADLSRPWMADYSAFVPDLIVGWQQHDAVVHALIAKVVALEQRM